MLKGAKIELNKNSGLTLFKNDLVRYGGSIEYEIIDGFFQINLRFLNYENI